jgi:shikimate dehydrogenase
MDALADSIGWSPGGRRCAVLGAGGAARAVILALADGGAADVAVINRTESSAMTAAALAGAAGRVGTAAADVPSAELVVNATSVGMASTPLAGQLPIDPGVLRPGQVVVDLVYHPRETPLLAAAASQGATPVDGVGMLVHQAARQFTWWTGLPVPLDAMRAAARSALG